MRTTKIKELAYKMRSAENHYLKTGRDSKKHAVVEALDALNLTAPERKLFCDICDSMGI